jgi:uncharacterized membrane protein HdeD (DUF308 family)
MSILLWFVVAPALLGICAVLAGLHLIRRQPPETQSAVDSVLGGLALAVGVLLLIATFVVAFAVWSCFGALRPA